MRVGLKSALEDFEGTTLSAIPGALGKLHYLTGLHDGQGNYSHWGMTRVHGEGAARRAIHTAHVDVLSQVLRTPLRVLDEDLRRAAAREMVSERQFLAFLIARAPRALVAPSAAPTEKHLTAVLRALSALLESPGRATRPDASPL